MSQLQSYLFALIDYSHCIREPNRVGSTWTWLRSVFLFIWMVNDKYILNQKSNIFKAIWCLFLVLENLEVKQKIWQKIFGHPSSCPWRRKHNEATNAYTRSNGQAQGEVNVKARWSCMGIPTVKSVFPWKSIVQWSKNDWQCLQDQAT